MQLSYNDEINCVLCIWQIDFISYYILSNSFDGQSRTNFWQSANQLVSTNTNCTVWFMGDIDFIIFFLFIELFENEAAVHIINYSELEIANNLKFKCNLIEVKSVKLLISLEV